jgi:glycosyltransferase involved in cell wall biosynthesis
METIIKALPLIPSDVTFVIVGPVGDQAYKESLIALAKSLSVSKRVIFAGVVRGADKYYLIKHAVMMTHMALWESYCNAVHEGMSQGLVCLVANNTALPLLIKNGKNGYCIETHDVEALADKIKFVLNPDYAKVVAQIGRQNREQVLKHSWDNVAITMENFYLKVFKKHV